MNKLLSVTFCICLLHVISSFSIIPERRLNLMKCGHQWEEYDSSLFYKLQSIDDIIRYADSIVGNDERQTRVYSEVLASIIRKRFYHGYSYYSLQDNWLAAMAGYIIWDHLHAIVLPDDIMKHPGAACSQQAIVLKECFKVAHIDYREIDLNGHFVLEGKVEGQWLLFDTNMEPQFPKGRKSLHDLLQSGEIAKAYEHVLDSARLKKVFTSPVYCQTNAPFAPNGTLFQSATGILSLVLPILLPLGLLVYLLKGMRGRKKPKLAGVKLVDVRVEEDSAVSRF